MKPYLKLMRIHHCIKNALIFAPLVFSGDFFRTEKLVAAGLAFLSFCFMSSAVYVVNDIRDVEKDRLHPTKCRRPIASGAVSVKAARVLMGLLLILACVCHGFSGGNLRSAALLATYFVLNLAYSFGLKNKPIVDIAILTSGFLLRVLYGAAVCSIEVSGWLYLTVISVSFYFSLGKRRNELVRHGGGETRQVLKYYTRSFLDKNMYMFLGLANVFYALWAMDNANKALIWTVPLVLLICMRYSLDIEGDSDGDPVEVLVHDKVLIALCLVLATVMMVLLYL